MLDLPVYRNLFHSSPVGEYLLAPTHAFTILDVNQAFLRATGRAREELIGRPLFEAFPADPRDAADNGPAALRASLLRVLETGQPDALALQRYPIPVAQPDGGTRFEERYWSAMNTPIWGEHGELQCIAHSTIDVTDLQLRRESSTDAVTTEHMLRLEANMLTRAQTVQQVNRALDAERVRLRHLFDHAPGLVYFTRGPDHVVEQVNHAFEALAGGAGVVGRTLREAFPLAPHQGLLAEHDAVLRSGRPYIAQGRRIELGDQPGGGARIVDLVLEPIVDAQGQVVGICGQGNDITDKAQAQDLLRRSAQRQAFQLALADRIRELEAPEDIVAAASEMLGRELCVARVLYSEIDEAGETFFVRRDWCHPRHGLPSIAGQRQPLDAFGPEIIGALRAGALMRVDDVAHHPATRRHAEMYARFGVRANLALPLVKAGRLTAILSLHHTEPHAWSDEDVEKCGDTAERTWAALEKARAQAELREADRRKDEFLAMLAHELRNPLAPVATAAQLIELGRLDAPRLKHTAQVISRQVRHMTGLVDDLLDVSRVTRGLVALDLVPQDLKAVVSNATEQVRPLIEKQRHALAIELPEEPAHVLGDAKRLVQILTNLLNNAAKYTPPGGQLSVSVAIEGNEVVLRVRDNGLGIPAELQPRLFELFVQAERTVDRSQGGLGLGLALVRSLVELHGGSVSCRSDGPGQGSCFTVRLPRLVRQHAPAERRQGRRSLEPGAARLKVLVVDDNTDAAETLSMLLETSGHEVVVQHRAGPALVAARAVSPDVCLLDIGLPDMDGKDLARHLRAQRETAHAVLIAITGYGQEQDRRSALDAGFDHHLVKPVDPMRLTALLAGIPAG